jgi:hypothetical protein
MVRPAYEVVPEPEPGATERSVWHAARAWAFLQAADPSRRAGLSRERIADWRMLALAEWELTLTWVGLEGERSAREIAGLMAAARTEPELVELHIHRRLQAAGIDPAEILPAGSMDHQHPEPAKNSEGCGIRLSGAITITPPLTHEELRSLPAMIGPSAVRYDITTTKHEIDTEHGLRTYRNRTASRIVPDGPDGLVRTGCDIERDVQRHVGLFPGREFTGYISGWVEDTGEVWQLHVRDGQVELQVAAHGQEASRG